jgi:hypothetical protein
VGGVAVQDEAMSGRRRDGRSERAVSVVLARLAEGQTLRQALKGEVMPTRAAWHDWVEADAELRRRFELARELGAEAELDELQEIADGAHQEPGATAAEQVQRSKLRVDTKKWRLACMFPRKFGDSVAVKHSGADGEGPVEVSDTASAARIAALLASARDRRDGAGASGAAAGGDAGED